MRSHWIRVDPNPISGVLIRRRFEYKHVQRETAMTTMEADWSGTSTSQGIPRVSRNLQKL